MPRYFMQLTFRSGAQLEFEVGEGSGVEFNPETGGITAINVRPAPNGQHRLDFVRVEDISAVVTRTTPEERPGEAGRPPLK